MTAVAGKSEGESKHKYKTITQCRICGNPDLEVLLDLGTQALTGVFPKALDEDVPGGPLQLVQCRPDANYCGLVQLRHSFDCSLMYGMNYGYRSGLNPSMVAHLQGKAREIKERASLQPGDTVLDIGSNDSTFLQAMSSPGVHRVGMDPTGIKFKKYYPDDIQLICDFFSAARFAQETGGKKAKVVTSISMFYDLETPMDFMAEVASVLTDDGIWVFEQSYLPTMLERTSYDTICHEHLEYYSLRQIAFMAERVGLRILDVHLNDINGGSFSVVAGKAGSSLQQHARVSEQMNKESQMGLTDGSAYQQFRERVFKHKDHLFAFLDDKRKQGKSVLGYGASTKGNVLLQYCGIGPRELASIVEVNQDKFGCFTPGSKIPIISEEDGRKMKPDGLLVLPWHFRDHIVRKEASFLKSGGELIFPLPSLEVVRNA